MGNLFGTEKEVIVELPYEDGQEGDLCYDHDETGEVSVNKRCQEGLICAPESGVACVGSCPLYCQDQNGTDISLPVITSSEYECREWIKNPNDSFTNTKKSVTFFDNVYKSATLN